MKLKLLVAALGVLYSCFVYSSDRLTGQITELWVNDGGNFNVVFISVGQDFTTTCPIGGSRYLIMDLSEPSMKEAYSMALAAFMSGKTISMAGSGQCTSGQGLEKLRYIYMVK